MLRYSIHVENDPDPTAVVGSARLAHTVAAHESETYRERSIKIMFTPMGKHAGQIATYKNGKRAD